MGIASNIYDPCNNDLYCSGSNAKCWSLWSDERSKRTRVLGPSGNDARSYHQLPFTLKLTPYWKGCAYVIATDLGGGAACKYDYCSMSGVPSTSLKIFLLRLASIRLWWRQCPPFARDCLRYHDGRLRKLDDPAIVESLSNGLAKYS